jgi:chorismate synthase
MMGTPMSSKNCSTGRPVAAPPAAMYLRRNNKQDQYTPSVRTIRSHHGEKTKRNKFTATQCRYLLVQVARSTVETT